jgi:hypothetical protein
VTPSNAAIALLALLSVIGCEAEAPPALPSVRTLSRVVSEGGRFEAVFTRTDPGNYTYVYDLHVVTAGAGAEGKPAVQLHRLDLITPVELEWTGDAKLLLKFGKAEVRGHQSLVQVKDKEGKTQQIEVVLRAAVEHDNAAGENR